VVLSAEEASLSHVEVLQGVLADVRKGTPPNELSAYRSSVIGQRALANLCQAGEFPAELLASLNFYELSTHNDWNFFIQVVVVMCPPTFLELICSSLCGTGRDLARHPVGYKVLCRVCEHGAHLPTAGKLLTELLKDGSELLEMHFVASYVLGKMADRLEYFPALEDLIVENISEACGAARTATWLHALCRVVEAEKLTPAMKRALAHTCVACSGFKEQFDILKWAKRGECSKTPELSTAVPTSRPGDMYFYTSIYQTWTLPSGDTLCSFSHYDRRPMTKLTWRLPLFDEELFFSKKLSFLHLGQANFEGSTLSASVIKIHDSVEDSYIVQVRCLDPPAPAGKKLFLCNPGSTQFCNWPLLADISKPFYLKPSHFLLEQKGAYPVRKTLWSLLLVEPLVPDKNP
jgi:hypothetical protein